MVSVTLDWVDVGEIQTLFWKLNICLQRIKKIYIKKINPVHWRASSMSKCIDCRILKEWGTSSGRSKDKHCPRPALWLSVARSWTCKLFALTLPLQVDGHSNERYKWGDGLAERAGETYSSVYWRIKQRHYLKSCSYIFKEVEQTTKRHFKPTPDKPLQRHFLELGEKTFGVREAEDILLLYSKQWHFTLHLNLERNTSHNSGGPMS